MECINTLHTSSNETFANSRGNTVVSKKIFGQHFQISKQAIFQAIKSPAFRLKYTKYVHGIPIVSRERAEDTRSLTRERTLTPLFFLPSQVTQFQSAHARALTTPASGAAEAHVRLPCSDAGRFTIAKELLKAGCRYAVCGGQTCEAWHDAIDEVFVESQACSGRRCAPQLTAIRWAALSP